MWASSSFPLSKRILGIVVTVVEGCVLTKCHLFPKGSREEALTCWRQLLREADENDSSSVRVSYVGMYRSPDADLSQRMRGNHL